MKAPALLLPISFLICFLLPFPPCNGAADPLGQYCSQDRNTTRATSANIGRVLDALVRKASADGFATAVSGDGGSGERAYGLAQCRGDVGAEDCRACLSDAARRLPELCPGQADARIWYDYCFLRYDTRDFAGQLDVGYGIFYINTENVTEDAGEQERFDRELGKVMGRVRAMAVAPANRGLGRAQTDFTPLVTVYALGQCTRDLPPLGCAQCVAIAVANFPNFCRHRKGCRALYSSCYVRYEIYPFFFPLSSSMTTATGSYSIAVVHP
uniref:Cysteine-rich repeat secretory protein 55 n=1 Tax=Anthurium amnicola TaxID=1678845 RepID=A0A1D1XH13_9ARAE